jgi:hypothetical protein
MVINKRSVVIPRANKNRISDNGDVGGEVGKSC